MVGVIFIFIFLLLFLGALPRWPHSRSWGYYPSGFLGLVVLGLVVLLFLSRMKMVEVFST